MIIEKLDWDSSFFGIKIGRLYILNDVDFDPILFKQQAIDEKFELVYVFKFQNMLPSDKILKANLDLVDIQLTMSMKFNKADYINRPYDFRTTLTDKEKNECYKIAENTAKVSRFYIEEKIGSEKTKAMYRRWIDNALNQSFSDGMFLFKEHDEVVGVHIIKTGKDKKTGHCSMIGVNPDYTRRNIGKKLWEQSFGYWANESEIEYCKVPFSFQNDASLNFHLNIGFNRVEETKFIYHFKR